MRKILLTWYGITDLTASFQSNLGNGPILGALKSDEYTDILILGYTNPNKKNIEKESFDVDKERIKKAFNLKKDSNLISNLIYDYANTDFSHKHFILWLREQLKIASLRTKVNFRPVKLTHLNDTEGIYNTSIKALDNIVSIEKEAEVWLYLSPGTPIMAFVWAFVSMRYPNTKIKLLASSKSGVPPEKIDLPKEWLELHGKQINNETDYDSFDVVFHLLGEQKMPSLLGIRQFDCKEHVFVNTKRYSAGGLTLFIEGDNSLEININPFNPEDVMEKILNVISKKPIYTRIGFNLTGGTKLMYAGALAACRKINGIPFYFDIGNKEVVYLDNFKKRVPIKEIENVETFIKLNSNYLRISNKGDSSDFNDRIELTKILWIERSQISKLYKEIVKYNKQSGTPFKLSNNKIYVELTKENTAKITINNKSFKFLNCPDFAKYLTGGWFEEYVYYRLNRLKEKGIIKDIRINFEVSYKENNEKQVVGQQRSFSESAYQEFDIIFTDGNKLYIVECKAGNIKSEYVRKLESITRDYGGIGAVGILACCFKSNNQVISKKAELSANVRLFAGNKLFDEFDNLLSLI
ncbi:DUF1887 family CARF protein [Algibacter sp. TI.3.09]|uniref:Card1-like endonuclease domain-containing protein n=1 Tax=Algibacter sp. TI.3.09 TaxID=3121298 RepID=UPI00311FE07C